MSDYADAIEPHHAAMHMIREAIGELFGPVADLESEDTVLLRGPEPHHQAEAIIAALQKVAAALAAERERNATPSID
ncbi:hypothetical protein [Mesorhizobium sp. CA7]|uniref:hypothetical protein n=1 Tax=Mesorhizobium sp. CA7 TaxID=588501 RepID=UPI001CCBDAF3|nr:hypothetical protein [Mesorhizobium sp. CA7]MBZ9815055.1 hypothetical protein [Mesorhizobium sp. CA7]